MQQGGLSFPLTFPASFGGRATARIEPLTTTGQIEALRTIARIEPLTASGSLETSPTTDPLPRRRVPLDRQEFGNEMAAAVFGGWISGTVWHTSGAALLGGLAGWLGYRRISRGDRG